MTKEFEVGKYAINNKGIGIASIAVHIVIGAMATQSRLVKFVTLWTFERTVKKNDRLLESE